MIAALSSANLMPPSTLLFFFKKIHSHWPVLFSLNLIRGVLVRPALHLPGWHFPTWLETEHYVRTTRMVIFCTSFWKNTLNIIINCHKSNRHWWLKKKWINIKKRERFYPMCICLFSGEMFFWGFWTQQCSHGGGAEATSTNWRMLHRKLKQEVKRS